MISLATLQEQYLKTYGAVLARSVMGITFIIAGYSKLVDITGTGAYIERAAGLPYGTVFAVLSGSLEVVGGLALVFGVGLPVAAFLLAGFTLLTSYFFHYPALWAHNPAQQIMFMKNLAIASGLLYMCAFGPGNGVRVRDLTTRLNTLIDEKLAKDDSPRE